MNLDEMVRENLSLLKHPAVFQKAEVQEHIVRYLTLLAKWNKYYNLTAIKTIDDMFFQHVMDSLSIVDYLVGSRIVDVGTGAGLPGIPLAIVRPDWQVTLVESNRKKTAFLQQVKIELALDNLAIKTDRVEQVFVEGAVNTIVSRAYASLGFFLKSTRHLDEKQNEQCRWVAMKGCCTQQELDEVVNPFCIVERIPLTVPGLSVRRELIIIKKMGGLEKQA